MGKLIQTTDVYTKTVVTGIATAIPIDGTPPLNTEGALFFTVNHTMLKTPNLLDIWVVVNMSVNTTNTTAVITLFDNADPNVLAASTTGIERTLTLENFALHTRYAPATTTPLTFSVRGGCGVTVPVTMNGVGGSSAFGNVPTMSGILIYEIEV